MDFKLLCFRLESPTNNTKVFVCSLIYSWNTLVHKNFEIESVCLELEREIQTLNQQAKER